MNIASSRRHLHGLLAASLISLVGSAGADEARLSGAHLRAEVSAAEDRFWEAYNACDLITLRSLLTEDIEFYHDKNGISRGIDPFMSTFQSNLCSRDDWRLRRSPIEGSLDVFAISDLGAIVTGEHSFFSVRGDSENLEGYGRFSTIWLRRGEQWKISRAISYDHRPYRESKRAISLSSSSLSRLAGSYGAEGRVEFSVTEINGHLMVLSGGFKGEIFPESELMFFYRERDLRFEFTLSQTGGVTKVSVHEKGKIVAEIPRIP